MVDDACYTPHHPIVANGQKILGFAELEGSIAILAQRMQLVAVQVGGIVLVATIQVVVELDEGIKVLLGVDFPNFY